MTQVHDIAIVGGGLVGSSLACALAPHGWRIVQIEAQPAAALAPAWDERNFALSRNGVQLLDSIGVWSHAAREAHPIRRVRVTSRGDFGAVRIRADDYGLDALGLTVPARALGAALEASLARLPNVVRIAEARVVELGRPDGEDERDAFRTLRLEAGGAEQVTRARLVIAADGSDSFVRDALGIGADRHDYAQTAIVATVVPERPHDGTAHERFTDTGPIAMLPLAQERVGLIYTTASTDAARLLALDDAAFLAEAGERAASPLGRLRRVGRRQPWPLRSVFASALTAHRAVVVGNAAQTLHPVGAQGFNLGLRDVAALAGLLRDLARDPGDDALLEQYALDRGEDRERTAHAADALVRWFAPDRELLRLARGASLALLDRIPAAKRELAFAMMGYRA